jgi:hypothetical protein
MDYIHFLSVCLDDLQDLLTCHASLYVIGYCVLSVAPTLLKEGDGEHCLL